MPDLDYEVGGIRCREVLAALSSSVDGELEPGAAERIEAHVRACEQCERFGGRFSALVRALREALGAPPAVPPDVARRLRARLGREQAEE